MIYSDSLSCLLAIESCKTQNPFTLNLKCIKRLLPIDKHVYYVSIATQSFIQKIKDAFDNPVFTFRILILKCKTQNEQLGPENLEIARNTFLGWQDVLFLRVGHCRFTHSFFCFYWIMRTMYNYSLKHNRLYRYWWYSSDILQRQYLRLFSTNVRWHKIIFKRN